MRNCGGRADNGCHDTRRSHNPHHHRVDLDFVTEELVETYYRADKYHYSVNMTRVKRQGRWTWTTEVETSA